jgi:hypothetical protein
MPAPKISDAEFMALVNEHQSTIRVAEILGSVPGVVRARKRRLERRHDWRAPQFDARKAYNTAPVHSDNKAVIQWDIDEGVILVGSDAHIWPGPLTTVQRAFLHFVKHFEPAPVGIVANGDWFDGSRVGRFPSIGFLESNRPKVKDELEAVQAFTGEIEKNARGAKLIWAAGNHDLRMESRLAAMVPEYEGMPGFHLKDYFPLWTPCWRLDVNDDLVIKHRWANGLHAVYNNTLKSGKSFVTGHLHSLKVTPWTDFTGTRYGVDCGTMADTDGDQFVHYLEAGPTNWRSGFVVLTIKGGKLMMPELVQKWDDDHVEFRGNLIKV